MWKPRLSFPHHNVDLSGFQGHHRKALFSLKQLAFQVDLVLELRDSRAPISTMNPLFDQALPGKPKFYLYTKADISPLKHSQILRWHPEENFLRINCQERKYARRVLEMIRKRVAEIPDPKPPLGYRVILTGMPNVGKSTFLNHLRQVGISGPRGKRRVARVGSNPGVTRALSEVVCIDEENKIFVHDTPGVFVPQANNTEQMLNLCLVASISPSKVDPVVLADYLLYQVNKQYPNGGRYPGQLTNDIHKLLKTLAKKKKAYSENSVALGWVSRFSHGGIAKLCLDEPTLENYNKAREDAKRQLIDLGSFKPDPMIRRRHML